MSVAWTGREWAVHTARLFDLIVIGAGLVGLASARSALARHPDWRVLVLERRRGPCQEQSGRNSGVLHSGLYYEPGSLRARLCREGKAAMEELCREAGIRVSRRGKVIVSTRERELPHLAELESRARANGVEVERLDPGELREREPCVRGVGALWVPGTGVVDFAQVGRHLLERSRSAGAEVRFQTPVVAVRGRATPPEVDLGDEVLQGRRVLVCAGLEADRLSGDAAGRVIPFRGEYRALDEAHRDRIRGLVYPVPDPALPFLGVHFTRGVDDVVEVGPNAVLALSRGEGRGVLRDVLHSVTWPGFWRLARRHLVRGGGEYLRSMSDGAFAHAARRLVPELETSWLVPAAHGLRAQLVARDGELVHDFRLHQEGAAVHVLNAPSPAATSSLALGRTLTGLLEEVPTC